MENRSGTAITRLVATLLLTSLALAATGGPPACGSRAAAQRGRESPIDKRVLWNGLTVLVMERHTAPVVTTVLAYRVGSRDEIPGSTGLAHFLEHLMFKGTRRIGKGRVDRLTYQNGGSNNAFTSSDFTAYFFSFPRTTWKTALRIEADRMRNLLIDPREFEAERKVVMEERRQSEDDPASQLYEQLNSVAFLAHPYRNPTIGWMSDLRRVTRREVVNFYARFYVPANAVLVITGDISAAEAFQAARAAFDAVPRLPRPRRLQVTEPRQTATRRVNLSLVANLPRLEMMAHAPRRGHPDAYSLEVLQYALTDGKTSRLYQRLVEKDRSAVSVAASLDAGLDAGLFFLEAELKPEAGLASAEAAVWEEIQAVARGGIGERELEKAKNAIEARFIHERETAQAAAIQVAQSEVTGGHQYLQTYLANIRTVSVADVQRVTRDYLQLRRASVGHLLPQPAGSAGSSSGRIPANPIDSRGSRRMAARRLRPFPQRGRYRRSRRGRTRRSSLPALANVRFAPLPVTERTLPNGLTLLLLKNHSLPSITMMAQVRAGSRSDGDAGAGLANFVGQMLEEGTRTYSHEQISQAFEQVGADYGAMVGRGSTTVFLKSLSAHFPSLLDLYAEMMAAPTFPAARADLERTKILNAIQAADEDPADVARRAFFEAVFGHHPNHRPVSGYSETVRRMTPEEMREFHARQYVPAATTIAVVGDFRTQSILAGLTRVFGGWPSRPAPSDGSRAPVRQTSAVTSRKTMEKAQTQIVLGHLGIERLNPDYVPLSVMDSILGEGVSGGFTARIPYQLRDVQGLAYTVGSSITTSATYDPGVFIAQMGTEPKNEAKAVPALLAEIRRIREQPVSERELREAVNYLINSYIFDFETNTQLASYLLTSRYYRLGFDYRQRYVDEVRRVTRADVQRVARQYLDPDRYTLIVVGPGAGSAR